MNPQPIEMIPVANIRIANPRKRNQVVWQALVASIRAVGLKKPITVSRRAEPTEEGATFDLVCGQGRLEAVKELGGSDIPAIVIEAPEPDRYLMSLVENIARKAPSHKSLYYEIKSLLARGYDTTTISDKLGLGRTYVTGMVHLVRNGETRLIQAVEGEELPVSVAVAIANGNDENIQQALAEGYKSGEFRGSRLQAVRKMIKQRSANQETNSDSGRDDGAPITGSALIRIYKERIAEQQQLVSRADHLGEQILVIVSAMEALLADEDFRTLLRAEGLLDMPEPLRLRMK
ncbi:ParB/RepB/Spo0J family partition protein [Acidicapsa dinghuensis]|uniref:ParB/RepB/Spo0J family partition protein n=1 Tax=Acidicapsa dinghuensis TaxID=2218256 RepID=A0ABW1EBP4_9BACT|nr:ParB N-terminal domain-containing protein [Acidicapsa dinghuensis]